MIYLKIKTGSKLFDGIYQFADNTQRRQFRDEIHEIYLTAAEAQRLGILNIKTELKSYVAVDLNELGKERPLPVYASCLMDERMIILGSAYEEFHENKSYFLNGWHDKKAEERIRIRMSDMQDKGWPSSSVRSMYDNGRRGPYQRWNKSKKLLSDFSTWMMYSDYFELCGYQNKEQKYRMLMTFEGLLSTLKAREIAREEEAKRLKEHQEVKNQIKRSGENIESAVRLIGMNSRSATMHNQITHSSSGSDDGLMLAAGVITGGLLF